LILDTSIIIKIKKLFNYIDRCLAGPYFRPK
jgi:hypothetical protein